MRGAPPRWFGAVMALLIGGLVATPALVNAEELISKELATLFLILGFAMVMGRQREQAGAWLQESPGGTLGRTLTLALVGGVGLALYGGGLVLRDVADLWWGPVATGIVAGVSVFLLAEQERRSALAPADREPSS